MLTGTQTLGRGAPRICRLRSRRDRDRNRAAQLRSWSSGVLQVSAKNSLRTQAAKNGDRARSGSMSFEASPRFRSR